MILNEKQQLLVNEHFENIILLASAGTGKTDTLSMRIAKIIEEKKAEPSEILCITFTNKACREMKERIEKLVGELSKDITIKTFHSFCFDIIKMQAKKTTDVFRDFVIYDEKDCEEILLNCNHCGHSIPSLKAFIDKVKITKAEENISTGNSILDYETAIDILFEEKIDKINAICTEKREFNNDLKTFLRNEGNILLEKYNSNLQNNHGLDFTDLIVITKELFNDKEIVKALSNKYKYINIDEVQDTSIVEYDVIESIFENNNILICGDIFQTIYQWRGSEPNKIFKVFKEKYNPLEIIFDVNYRATKNLTDASLGYLENSFPEQTKEIYKTHIKSESEEEGEKIVLKVANNIAQESYFLFEKIKELSLQNTKLPETCILTRDNFYNVDLSKNLKKLMDKENLNFEFILVDQYKFFRRQEIKDIMAFLKLLANRHDSLSLERIAKRFPTGIGEKTLSDINSDDYKNVGISLSDFINSNVLLYGEIYALLINEYQNNNVIVFDVESTGIDVTKDEIIQIAAIKIDGNGDVISKFERFIRSSKSTKASQHIHGFSDEYLEKHGENKKSVLKDFIEFSKNAVIVGHNVQYDINILTSELEREQIGKPQFKAFYDTLDIYKRFYPKVFNHKLETLSKEFGTSNKPSHNAMDDILATAELLVRAINLNLIPTQMKRIGYTNKHLKAFSDLSKQLDTLFNETQELRPYSIVEKIVKDFQLEKMYPQDERIEKINRIRDFYRLLREIDDKNKNAKDALLNIVMLTSISNGELEEMIIRKSKKTRIPIITVHQAKGLEFENVFISGVQKNTFPSYRSLKTNDLEEEKRTFYVALTRAKQRLYITCNTSKGQMSPFIGNIPSTYIKNEI